MQKKTRFKSPLRDAIVITFCVGCAAFFLFLFWQDLNRMSVRSDKDRVATVTFKNRVAQRKFSDRVVWERISQNAAVYNGDILRTADLAQATVHFDNGTALDLYENTMVQIQVGKDGRLQVSIDGGDIQVESTAESAVSLVLDDGSTVTIDAGGSLAAKADVSGSRTVEVKSGTARIETESGEAASLVTGEAVSVEEGGAIQKRPVTVTSVPKEMRILRIKEGRLPPPPPAGPGSLAQAESVPLRATSGALSRATPGDLSLSTPGAVPPVMPDAVPVHLAWTVSDDEPVIVETSFRRDFSELSLSALVQEKETELSAYDGTLYWRVYTENAVQESAQGKITVEPVAALSAVSPQESALIRYRTTRPRISFRWNGNSFADRYELTVSETPDMRSPVLTLETRDAFAVTDALSEGSYWWQVTPVYTMMHVGSGESAVSAFTIEKNPVIRAPELSLPADGARLVRKSEAKVSFMWKSELLDADYELLIARDEEMTDVVCTRQASGSRLTERFDESSLPDGTYYWKVRRHARLDADREDDAANESAVRSFSIAAWVPQENKLLFPPDSYSAEMEKVSDTVFVWKLGDSWPEGTETVLQVSKNEDFSAMQLERTTSLASIKNLLFAPGTYWWRVGVRAEDGSLEGLTPARSFTVLRKLSRPVITSPLENAEELTWNSSPLLVRWTSVPGADYYDIAVLDEQGAVVTRKDGVHDTETKLVLTPGAYSLRAQAVASETPLSPLRTGEEVLHPFVVRHPSPLVSLSPASGERISGLTALRSETVFRWREGKDSAESVELLLYKTQSDGSEKLVERIQNAKSGISFTRLTPGTYSWRLRASTAGGFPLDSARSRFTVEAVPSLVRPVLTSPAQNLVMDFAYLRKNRTISFAWLPVEGATDYSFALYKKEADGSLAPVMHEKRLTSAQVKFKKLKMLDVGEFVWYVTAYTHAKDGYEEQASAAAAGSFSILFDRPKKVELITPERMYAQ
ncbi:MAG: FecR family protein [Treponema sp.]|nr:FecR family protein [Treponema sp.]